MGEAGHCNMAFVSVALLGKDQAQDFAGSYGIVGISLIKVTHAVQ